MKFHLIWSNYWSFETLYGQNTWSNMAPFLDIMFWFYLAWSVLISVFNFDWFSSGRWIVQCWIILQGFTHLNYFLQNSFWNYAMLYLWVKSFPSDLIILLNHTDRFCFFTEVNLLLNFVWFTFWSQVTFWEHFSIILFIQIILVYFSWFQ